MPTLLRLLLLLRLLHSLHALPLHQPLMPRPGFRGLLLHLLLEALSQDSNYDGIPSHEHEICETDLVAHEILLAGLGQLVVDDRPDALDLVEVAVLGARDVLFWVELNRLLACSLAQLEHPDAFIKAERSDVPA